MATEIKTLIDKKTNRQFIPLAHTKSVVDDKGNTVENILKDLQEQIWKNSPQVNYFSETVNNVRIEIKNTELDGKLVFDYTSGMFLWHASDMKYYNSSSKNIIAGTYPVIGQAYHDDNKNTYVGIEKSLSLNMKEPSDKNSFYAKMNNEWNKPFKDSLGESTVYGVTQKTVTDMGNNLKNQIDNIKPVIIENGSTVTNLPDGEDIESTEENKLKFKDRSRQYGKGYKILRTGKTFKEQVEGGINSNTIFEIRYDFDLGGKDDIHKVTLPENCTLNFIGGKLKNGVINLNKVNIISNGNTLEELLYDIQTDGNFKEGQLIYDGKLKIYKYYNGTNWSDFDGNIIDENYTTSKWCMIE